MLALRHSYSKLITIKRKKTQINYHNQDTVIGERDTIKLWVYKGVYKFELVRCMRIYICVWRYVCRMPHIRNVGRVRPLPFFICASSFKRSYH